MLDKRLSEARHAAEVLRTEPFWQAQATLVGALILYLTLPSKLTVGPNWLMPALELLLVRVHRIGDVDREHQFDIDRRRVLVRQ